MGEAVLLERSGFYRSPDYDGLWKKLISDLFEEFMLFFAPDLYEQIDFNKAPDFLEQELYKEVISDRKGKKIVDKIVKVSLKGGKEKWILIHIEIQAEPGENFSKRMFRYFYRIYDKFDREIFAIALLTSEKASSHPDYFHYSFYDTTVNYTYPTYKFHEQNIAQLEKSSNPFAAAVIAAKYANKYKNDTEKRFYFKRKLMIQIVRKFSLQKENTRKYITTLFYFIDYLLQTPKSLDSQLKSEVFDYVQKEEKEKMDSEEEVLSPTLAGVYELMKEEARKKGKKIGLEEGRRTGLEEGRKAGLEEGRRAGLEEGRRAGIDEGRRAGIDEGRKVGLEEGRREGIEEGRKVGREIGWQEGRVEGKQEAKINFAKALIQDGFPDEKIAKLTELEEEVVIRLRNELRD